MTTNLKPQKNELTVLEIDELIMSPKLMLYDFLCFCKVSSTIFMEFNIKKKRSQCFMPSEWESISFFIAFETGKLMDSDAFQLQQP